MRRSEIAGIAAGHFWPGAKPERLDIIAQQRPCLGAIVDEQRERRATRDRLNAKRAGPREKVEHASACKWIVIGMEQDVKQRFAQTIRCWANVTGGRRCEVAALQAPADDTHQRYSSSRSG